MARASPQHLDCLSVIQLGTWATYLIGHLQGYHANEVLVSGSLQLDVSRLYDKGEVHWLDTVAVTHGSLAAATQAVLDHEQVRRAQA